MSLPRSLLAALLLAPLLATSGFSKESALYPVFNKDRAEFDDAISAEAFLPAYTERPSGLIVPHHLLAAPLIARGFKLVSGHRYKRVIVLFPDHFRRVKGVFASSSRSFDTLYGKVETDEPAVAELLSNSGLVEDSDLFSEDHGIRALLPFLKHYLPDTPVVPVAIATKATRQDADRLADVLRPLITEDTLIVQSTDFSHFLPFAEARAFDQQTLNILASGDLDQIAGLSMPMHLDSPMALYLNALLQADIGADLHVVASRNSNEYFENYLKETTSYLTAIYGRFEAGTGHPVPDNVSVHYIAGDFTLGRNNLKLALQPVSVAAVRNGILEITRGRPLMVNLEGAILPELPKSLREKSLAMPESLVGEWFDALNIHAVSLANNHTGDFGALGHKLTENALLRAGIKGLPNLRLVEFDRFVLFAATDLTSTGDRQIEMLSEEDLDTVYDYQGPKAVIAFLHWGTEYKSEPTGRALELAHALRKRGVSLVIGAHPHVRSGAPVSLSGGESLMIYSLGNFLFDQSSRISSGAIAEIRFFPQGTHFTRLLDIPNFYEIGRNATGN